jgi:predicted small lipoprotein YifL
MKNMIAIAMVLALAACGSKAKKSTMPENKGGTDTEVKSSGSSTGGTTYGGAMKPTTPTAPTPPTGGGADPCAGGK